MDDEPANVRLLTRLLGSRGYRNVRSTTDPNAVLDIWEEYRPHLLLLDLMMPGCDGIEVMTRLRAALGASLPARLPVLILTADATERAREVSLANGAQDLVTKPFEHDEVIGRIEQLLEHELSDRSAGSM